MGSTIAVCYISSERHTILDDLEKVYKSRGIEVNEIPSNDDTYKLTIKFYGHANVFEEMSGLNKLLRDIFPEQG